MVRLKIWASLSVSWFWIFGHLSHLNVRLCLMRTFNMIVIIYFYVGMSKWTALRPSQGNSWRCPQPLLVYLGRPVWETPIRRHSTWHRPLRVRVWHLPFCVRWSGALPLGLCQVSVQQACSSTVWHRAGIWSQVMWPPHNTVRKHGAVVYALIWVVLPFGGKPKTNCCKMWEHRVVWMWEVCSTLF